MMHRWDVAISVSCDRKMTIVVRRTVTAPEAVYDHRLLFASLET